MRFFDFFAGIGGFRLGMEMAGHECVGHCEIDKHAQKSYIAMHYPKESEVFFEDVRTINPTDMPECDCYCGGFPCQSFSIAGKRGGFEDTRGTLFFEVMRLAKERHPKYLLLENVRGLLNHDGGRTFETIIRTMDELGYLVEWQVFNSKYFGVPQHRERVYIIGHFGGKPGTQILPIRPCDKPIDELPGHQNIIAPTMRARQDNQTGGIYPMDGGGFMLVNGYHKKDKEKMEIRVKQGTKKGYIVVKPGGVVNMAYPESKNRRCRVIDGGDTASTLVTGSQLGVVEVNGKKLKVRKLTPRECFRLQGFPDEYYDRAAAVCSDSQLYKQAGNAVTVNVVYEIARRLKP